MQCGVIAYLTRDPERGECLNSWMLGEEKSRLNLLPCTVLREAWGRGYIGNEHLIEQQKYV